MGNEFPRSKFWTIGISKNSPYKTSQILFVETCPSQTLPWVDDRVGSEQGRRRRFMQRQCPDCMQVRKTHFWKRLTASDICCVQMYIAPSKVAIYICQTFQVKTTENEWRTATKYGHTQRHRQWLARSVHRTRGLIKPQMCALLVHGKKRQCSLQGQRGEQTYNYIIVSN